MSVISFTELVAWYGAVLATFVACFELWKWIHSRALLKVTIRPRVPLAPSAWGGVAGLEYRADNCITPARSENLTQQHGNLDRNGKIAQQV